MVKQLVELDDKQSAKADRLAKKWKVSKTDVMKKVLDLYNEGDTSDEWLMENLI